MNPHGAKPRGILRAKTTSCEDMAQPLDISGVLLLGQGVGPVVSCWMVLGGIGVNFGEMVTKMVTFSYSYTQVEPDTSGTAEI